VGAKEMTMKQDPTHCLDPACDAPLVLDPHKTGQTCGGLALKGWMHCATCGHYWLASASARAVASIEWTLAKGGHSLNCGGVRIRAEKSAERPGALMARIQRLPLLEAVLADDLIDIALGYLTSDVPGYDSGEKAMLIAELRSRLRELRVADEAESDEQAAA
jgi:hypothetical protein